jgi:death-on-curing family protein
LGGVGVRDANLLVSAVHRQFTSYGNKEKYKTDLDKIAALFFGLIKNHAFYDANKRTAFIVALWQLEKMNLTPTVSGTEFEDFAVEIADDEYKQKRRYKKLALKFSDPEVRYISFHLGRLTRKLDKRTYEITFRDLAVILQRFGFDLLNLNKNFIDVVKVRESKGFFGLGAGKPVSKRILQVACPGMGRRVPRSTVSDIRRECKLSDRERIDSAVFYQDLPPVALLIGKYNEPLRSLADR